MSDILSSFSSYFKTNYVIVDNNMCRMHYKASVVVLIAFSLLVTAKQYVGDPIDCVVPKDFIDNKMLDTYCWIHKTFSVNKSFKGELGQEIAYPGVAPHKPGDALVYHSYYQWVFFVLFLQAIAFYVPHFLWKLIEGGRIKQLMDGLKSPLLTEKERDEKAKPVAFYLHSHRKHHTDYLAGMVATEIFYMINLIVQIYLMDVFLNGEFSKYGWRVATFTEWHWEARYDPMIKVFPRMGKCTFRMYGSSGGIQTFDAVCVLPINIINEKIYVFLWFWFMGLLIATGIWLIYRTATIFITGLRRALLQRKSAELDEDILDFVIDLIPRGTWFLMYQLSKNIDPISMQAIMEHYGNFAHCPDAMKLVKEREEKRESEEKKEKEEAETKKAKKVEAIVDQVLRRRKQEEEAEKEKEKAEKDSEGDVDEFFQPQAPSSKLYPSTS